MTETTKAISNLACKKARSIIDLFDRFMKPDFKQHSLNVADYAVAMRNILVKNGCGELSEFTDEEVFISCAFHDVGKSLIPTEILGKTEQLDDLEWSLMREHPRLGKVVMNSLVFDHNQLGHIVSLKLLEAVAYLHHERWDGKGYMSGLKGSQIHPLARLCSIADTYDAITSDRPYRKGTSVESALEVLACVSGSQLDESYVLPLLADISWTKEKYNYSKS